MATGGTPERRQTLSETTGATGGAAVGTITAADFKEHLQLGLRNFDQIQRVVGDDKRVAQPLAEARKAIGWCYDHLAQLTTYAGGMDAGPPGS